MFYDSTDILWRKIRKHKTIKEKKIGTFGGVFTPSALTILGVILFLRYDVVVGSAGLWGTLAILLLANLFTIITTLSLSGLDKRAFFLYYLCFVFSRCNRNHGWSEHVGRS